ncbi:MAG: methionine--tRNA ligase [Alphaproteobacteria bacterium]
MTDKNFYITTPIYYVNDRPHIGHAYTSVACDVLARYHRLLGHKVKFLTGTDEHGQKVEKSANAAGVSPQEFTDTVSRHFLEMSEQMDISYDDFIRTTEERHVAAAQAIWKKMEEAGYIYLGSYAGWYAVRDEAYYAESELLNGKAPTGAEVEWVEEPSYFFKLSAFEGKLLEYYDKHPDFIAPTSRRNEVISFVKGGLKDLSVSRTTFSWGIPVPGNPDHIMYVWLDALTNYLSAVGYPDTKCTEFKDFWPASLHMVGKDILRFHAVYWPAFLMAADLPLPDRIFAHGWWTIEGEKMSKSLGNVVAPADMINEYGLDATRWFLLREVPFGNDGNFSKDALITRVNSELANNVGNLAQRTLTIINKHCGASLPECRSLNTEEIAMVYNDKLLSHYHDAMNRCAFHEAMQCIIQMGNEANIYIDEKAPWKLRKENPEEMKAVLYCLAENIRIISILLQPFIPVSSSKILDSLAVPEDSRSYNHTTQHHALKSGTILPPPSPVFPRLGGLKPQEGAA